MTKVKICGLMSAADAQAAREAGADYAGMILSSGFRRTVGRKTASEIRNSLQEDIELCGVFVNEPYENVKEIISSGLIDAVQLHGDEDNVYIGTLKKDFPQMTVIKAFTVRSAEDVRKAEDSYADIVIMDAGKGEGKIFDWNLLKGMRRDYILAGGLTPDNVTEAVSALRPYGVDTSSGVETDGRKEAEKIRSFVKNAKEVIL